MSQTLKAVAVLFARSDSVYKSLPGCDVYDIERDARTWPGMSPVVAHPPCRAWGRLRTFAHPRPDEKALGPLAVSFVRRFGGVLEHPAESTLWGTLLMPWPGRAPDQFGGWTMAVDQFHFGHRAQKPTWLYIVGVHPDDLPPVPFRDGRPTHCIRPAAGSSLPSVPKPEREHTPVHLAEWLVEVARRSVPRGL